MRYVKFTTEPLFTETTSTCSNPFRNHIEYKTSGIRKRTCGMNILSKRSLTYFPDIQSLNESYRSFSEPIRRFYERVSVHRVA